MKKLLPLLIALCLIHSALALTTYEENNAVGRIVGESPSELLMQMNRNSVHIYDASYFSTQGRASEGFLRLINTNENKKVLESKLNLYTNVNNNILFSSRYNFEQVTSRVNEINKNELIIIESDGNHNELNVRDSYLNAFTSSPVHSSIDTHGVRAWQDSFTENNPVLVLASPYAGSHFPKEDSLVTRLVRDSTIIAPSSYNSRAFVRSLACEFHDGLTVGEWYRNARNLFYNAGFKERGLDTPVGMALQSYSLYGNPQQEIFTSWNFFDQYQINKYCKNFLQNLAPGIEYLGPAGDYSMFRRHVSMSIDEYEIIDEGDFQYLYAPPAFDRYSLGELIVPMAVRTTSFPHNTIIIEMEVINVGDPVHLTIPNLPMFNGDYVARMCEKQTEPFSITFTNSFNRFTQDVLATIIPVEITDCEKGELTLYRTFNYTIDYIPITPATIVDIKAPLYTKPESTVEVEIELLKITESTEEGLLAIYDETNNVVWENNIQTSQELHVATFNVPERKGFYRYSVEFKQDDRTLSYQTFGIDVLSIYDASRMPVNVRSGSSVPLSFISLLDNSVSVQVTYTPIVNGEIRESNIEVVQDTFSPGLNERTYTFNLPISYESYTLVIEVKYLDEIQTSTQLVVINNPPALYHLDPIIVNTREKVAIPYPDRDIDEDTVTVTVEDTRFALNGSHAVWIPGDDDHGIHTVTLHATDGYLSTSRDYTVVVQKPDMCVAEWVCEEWSTCQNGIQTRLCNDINSCDGTLISETPDEIRICSGNLRMTSAFSDGRTSISTTAGTLYIRIQKTDTIHNATLRVRGSQ